MRKGKSVFVKAAIAACLFYMIYLLLTSKTSRIEKEEEVIDESNLEHLRRRGPGAFEASKLSAENEHPRIHEQLEEPKPDEDFAVRYLNKKLQNLTCLTFFLNV